MHTIKDVARLAGVSPSTISKYMNGGNVREENAKAILQPERRKKSNDETSRHKRE